MSDPFLGEIKLVPYEFEPKGWAYCDGRELPMNQSQGALCCCGEGKAAEGREHGDSNGFSSLLLGLWVAARLWGPLRTQLV